MQKRALVISAITIWLWTSSLFAQKPIPERFLSLEWRSPKTQQPFRYRLYVPEKTTGEAKRPLLMWMHGAGERGEENLKNLRWMNLVFDVFQDAPPFFILIQQHTSDEEWFSTTKESSKDDEDALDRGYQILEDVIGHYPVDEKQIYLTGVSSGGSACWELACRHPERFAAVAPLASGGGDTSRATRLVDIPIWAFHVRTDQRPTPEGVRRMVKAVRDAGGVAELTETEQDLNVELSTHNCWNAALEDYRVLSWMLQQRKGQPVAALPGLTTWQSFKAWLVSDGWVWLVWLSLAMLVVIGWRSSLKRRRNVTA